jgi:serine/threonine-protein kinase
VHAVSSKDGVVATTCEFSEQLARSLSGRYRLISALGSGGSANVYVADCLRTGQRVAIKVLREELAAAVSARRFLEEINIVARLEHPNIVPLCAVGNAGGLPFYVMPLLAGQSLRTRMNCVRTLPLDEAVRVCTDVAAALDYAHRQRIVHRDIKPENILLHQERALVLDFGIAVAVGTVQQPNHALGSLPGTPAYMSPEQAAGEPYVDGRSDVYSLACVTYEMICGHTPFAGNAAVVLRRHITAEPLPLCCRLSTVPHGLTAVVARALAKAPGDRFETPGAFAAALRREYYGSCRSLAAERLVERSIFETGDRQTA